MRRQLMQQLSHTILLSGTVDVWHFVVGYLREIQANLAKKKKEKSNWELSFGCNGMRRGHTLKTKLKLNACIKGVQAQPQRIIKHNNFMIIIIRLGACQMLRLTATQQVAAQRFFFPFDFITLIWPFWPGWKVRNVLPRSTSKPPQLLSLLATFSIFCCCFFFVFQVRRLPWNSSMRSASKWPQSEAARRHSANCLPNN